MSLESYVIIFYTIMLYIHHMIWYFKYIYHIIFYQLHLLLLLSPSHILYIIKYYTNTCCRIPQLLLLLLSTLNTIYILHNLILYVIQIILSSSIWSSSSSTESCHNSSVNFSCHIITSLVVPWTLCLHFTYYILHTLSVLCIYIIWYDIYIHIIYIYMYHIIYN